MVLELATLGKSQTNSILHTEYLKLQYNICDTYWYGKTMLKKPLQRLVYGLIRQCQHFSFGTYYELEAIPGISISKQQYLEHTSKSNKKCHIYQNWLGVANGPSSPLDMPGLARVGHSSALFLKYSRYVFFAIFYTEPRDGYFYSR